jgi:hypothetical protein
MRSKTLFTMAVAIATTLFSLAVAIAASMAVSACGATTGSEQVAAQVGGATATQTKQQTSTAEAPANARKPHLSQTKILPPFKVTVAVGDSPNVAVITVQNISAATQGPAVVPYNGGQVGNTAGEKPVSATDSNGESIVSPMAGWFKSLGPGEVYRMAVNYLPSENACIIASAYLEGQAAPDVHRSPTTCPATTQQGVYSGTQGDE